MRILLVGNPISGSGRGSRLIDTVSGRLERVGHEVTTVRTRARGDARTAAARHEADTIVAVGGDGTINEVVNGLAGRPTPIAVVPAGVGNVLARALDLPHSAERVCRAVRHGRTITVDGCVMGGNRFLLLAGAGLDARVVHAVAGRRTGTLSYFSYFMPAITAWMKYARDPFSVEIDGNMICDDAVFCVLANVGNYIGRWQIIPGADPADGLLDVLVFRGRKRADLAGFAASFLLQRHLRRNDVICARGRTVKAFSPTGAMIPVHADGDPMGCLPVHVTVAPGSVRIVVPADRPGGPF